MTTFSQSSYTHYVDGHWIDPQSRETVPIVDPSSGEQFSAVPCATVAEVEMAVQSARSAFDEGPWPRMSGSDRAKIMHGFADALWRHRDEVVELVVRQGGCTLTQARGIQVYTPIQLMHRYADLAERNPIERVQVSGGLFSGGGGVVRHSLAIREPAGVVAAITPFNYPFFLNVQKIGPALATGCTVVLKPSETTCLDAALIARIADEETDLPAGVLNVLLGGRGELGEFLCAHPMVDQITFTGSTATGRRIMTAAAATIKRLTLELGGKSANVIFSDADLDAALGDDCGLVIRHCGQGCGHLSRVLVEQSIHDEVVQRMMDRAGSVVVGDPMEPATEMGPLASAAQWTRVKGYIDSGIEEGAQLRVGGDRPPDQPQGYFMAPTVFSDVRPDMRIYQEEIFGPVVVVQAFHDEDEAVRLANSTIYGLNGAVWSRGLDRALRVAGRMRTGVVTVNSPRTTDLSMPYGGYKQSGVGREFDEWAYNEYTELKNVRYVA